MSKISKVDAFKTMVQYIECDRNDMANAVFKIINRSQNQDRKNNVISNYIELQKKEEKYFKDELIINETNDL